MPLTIQRIPRSPFFYLIGTVRGERIRESTGTRDIHVAEEIRRKREQDLYNRFIHGDRFTRTFGEAALAYLQAEARSEATGRYVAKLIAHFGDTRLADIDQNTVEKAYRALLRPGATGATKLRGVLTPLKAIMEHAALSRWCDRPVFRGPTVDKVPTSFMLPGQATALVQAAAPHLRPLLVFLIGTGCRMSEALELEWDRVDMVGARALVWQKQQNQRRVDLPPAVVAALSVLPHRTGRLFRPPPRTERGREVHPTGYADTGRTSGGQIGTAWAGACHRAGLAGTIREWVPRGKKRALRAFVPELTPHDCRHTWASWHYAIHRDLLRLKTDGGWSTVHMVERYAHMMPAAHVDDARAWLEGTAVPLIENVA